MHGLLPGLQAEHERNVARHCTRRVGKVGREVVKVDLLGAEKLEEVALVKHGEPVPAILTLMREVDAVVPSQPHLAAPPLVVVVQLLQAQHIGVERQHFFEQGDAAVAPLQRLPVAVWKTCRGGERLGKDAMRVCEGGSARRRAIGWVWWVSGRAEVGQVTPATPETQATQATQ